MNEIEYIKRIIYEPIQLNRGVVVTPHTCLQGTNAGSTPAGGRKIKDYETIRKKNKKKLLW